MDTGGIGSGCAQIAHESFKVKEDLFHLLMPGVTAPGDSATGHGGDLQSEWFLSTTRSGCSWGQAQLRCSDLMPTRGTKGSVAVAAAHIAPYLHHG